MAMTGLQPSWPFLYANCILAFQTPAGRSDAVSRRDLTQLTENHVPPRMARKSEGATKGNTAQMSWCGGE